MMIGGAELLLQLQHQVEDLRLDGDVERRGRLVGDQHARIAGQRDGDHHALAHAAGELMRILVEPPARVGDAAPGRASRCARSSAARQGTPQCRTTFSAICVPMVSTGLRLVIGSWKIIEILWPRMLAHLLVGERGQLAPVEAHRAGDDAAGLRRDQPQDRQRRHRLAAAGLADDAERLAGARDRTTRRRPRAPRRRG